MSASLKTPNFQLPYFAPSDYTSWADYNEAVNKIDTALKSQETNSDNLEIGITAIQNSLEALTEDVQTDQQEITKNTQSIQTLKSNINLINQIDTQQNQKIATIEETITGIGIQWKAFNMNTLETVISNKVGAPPIIAHLGWINGVMAYNSPTAYNLLKAIGSYPINSATNLPDYIGFKLDGIKGEPQWEIKNATITATPRITSKTNSCEIGAFRSANKVIDETVVSMNDNLNEVQFFVEINKDQIQNILEQQNEFFKPPLIISVAIEIQYSNNI